MADHVVDRNAGGLRVRRVAGRLVVQRRRDRALFVEHELVAEAVEFGGRDARDDVRRDEVEHFARETAGDAHLGDIVFVLSVIAIEVCLECGELTDYRTFWQARSLPAVRMRVFADCPAGCRAASESGERLESGQIGVLYSLAKSISIAELAPCWGGIADGRLAARAFACRIASRRNQGAGRAEFAPFGAGSRGGTAAGLRPNPRGEFTWQLRCAKCWKRVSTSVTRRASGTRRWLRSFSVTATRFTSSTSKRRCRCSRTHRSTCASWQRTAARSCSSARSVNRVTRSPRKRSAQACRSSMHAGSAA